MGSDQSWQFVCREAVSERPPTRDTGHPGRPITRTGERLRDEEGDDAAPVDYAREHDTLDHDILGETDSEASDVDVGGFNAKKFGKAEDDEEEDDDLGRRIRRRRQGEPEEEEKKKQNLHTGVRKKHRR